ncbi:MAG TPA: hypothetical protein VFA55_04880, partial [Candidatus Kapabacteria bacterium]|nr:hypothetical protein [Candidatus Kapabacteria bacterium]
MKILYSALVAVCAAVLLSVPGNAQTHRAFHSERIILDNNSTPLYFYTLKTPDGMVTSDTFSFPLAPPNNPASGFVYTGNNVKDLLHWEVDPVLYPQGAWVPIS